MANPEVVWTDVLRIWNELDVPEGWRPEVTPEGITVTPPPGGSHNITAAAMHRLLVRTINEELEVFQTLGVEIEARGIFVPDLCVVTLVDLAPSATRVDCRHVPLAVEITSRGNAGHDRNRKRLAYAQGSIPLYMLIDPFDDEGPRTSVFSTPRHGDYTKITRVRFGEMLTLPHPVNLTVDTSRFPQP